MKYLITSILSGIIVLSLTGCKLLVPAHPNSNYPDAKNTNAFQITLLDYTNAIQYPDFANNYIAAFGHLPGTKSQDGKMHPDFLPAALVAAPIVAAAVGFTMNYISQSISNDASTYQAQFGDTATDDKFLTLLDGKTNIYRQNYYGFEVIRQIDTSKKGTTNAFRLVCGISHTEDGELFVVKPLIFETKKTKAKIVGDGFASWLAVYPHLFLKPGSQVNSTVNFTFVGYFRDKDQTMKNVPMGTFSFKFNGYDMTNPKPLSYVSGNMPKQTSGFIDSAPLSYVSAAGSDTKPVATHYAGNVALTVNVTETDASNVKENLSAIAQFVTQERPAVTMWITNQISK